MKRFVKIIIAITRANLATAVIYRTNIYGGIVSTLLWMILSVVSISVLTYQSSEIGGWNRYQLFAVQGVYSIILGLMYFFFGDNFKKLVRSINRGDLDLVLTKPIDSQFLVSVGEAKVYQLARVIGGVALLIISMQSLQTSLDVIRSILFMLFVISSCTIIYSIWFSFTTLTIWFVNIFNLNELFIYVTGLTRYPLEILRYLSQYLFYVMMPLVVITTVPAQILLHKLNLELIIWSVILAVGLFWISRKFWQFALRYYTSASS